VLNVCWTSDGTEIAAAGGSGAVCFGHLVERQAEWKNLVVTVSESNKMKVHDILRDNVEELDFRDKIIKVSMGHDCLVIATATQCWIYSLKQWTTPHVFDVKDTVTLIQQSKK
jgi:intraflagellar transport protein 80